MRPKNIEKEQAIRRTAMQIIEREGLENLSMQKLAAAANVSPRTIYIKYKDKEDFLVKLFIDETMVAYEKAVLEDFDEKMDFGEGMKKLWMNTFRYFKKNGPSYALMRYGRSSPMLNKALREKNIKQGQFFSPIHRFLKRHTKKGIIRDLPFDVQRAMLFAPLMELANEYYDHKERNKQIVTDKVLMKCCEAVIRGMTR